MLMLPDFRVRQRDYLLEISRAMSEELDLSRLLQRILVISMEMLAAQGGLIALRDDQENWSIPNSEGLPDAFLQYLSPILDEISRNSEPDQFELLAIHKELSELARRVSRGAYTGVMLPLVARKTIVGVIYVFRGYTTSFSQNDRNLLQSFADQAAIAVQNAQLYTNSIQTTQRIDALLDTVADGILILNSNMTVHRCNPALAKMLERSIREVIRLPHDQVITWATPPSTQTLEQAVASGWPLDPHSVLYVEGDLKRAEALGPLPVGVTYAPLFSKDNQLLNIIATFHDISHFREADQLKSTFISVISHELKTPLALIKGYVSTLRREDAKWDSDVTAESLQVIEEETDHLSELVDNLLDASRLQSGSLSVNKADFNFVELAKGVAQRMQTQSQNHRITIDFPPDFPVILGDEKRLSQVLTNLVSNSIKYSSQGNITIQGRAEERYVLVCVTDQGKGISPIDAPHVFDRFYRAIDAAKLTKGAGLGLFLSRAIIEAHGGTIWVDPHTQSGTRICFSLPR